MSRLELNAIQSKLKAAIQNHQMLVVKMKGDNQNASLKKGLADLQEEIKKLSEEQKKIVVKLRESLVKSTPQAQPSSTPANPIVTVGQTITAIGQPRLVSFPTQGGATILPVGMVAVPIAHMQRPAVGVAIHPAGTGQMSQATNLSLIPAGIISSGCNISLSSISSGAPIGINNNVGGLLHGSIAISSMNSYSGSNGAVLNSSTTTTPSTGISVNDSNVILNTGNGSVSVNASNNNCIVSAVASSAGDPVSNSGVALSNMTNLVISNNINNHIVSNSSTSISNCLANGTSTISVASTNLTNNHPTSTTPSSSTPSVLVSSFPQQPLVQPQLLQQQQQQILQMIQAQQQQQQPPPPPQQGLASHLPIKVPQYTASLIRPTASTVQYCNIAPAQSTTVTVPVIGATSSPLSTSTNPPSNSKAIKPIISKENGGTGKDVQHKLDIQKPKQQNQKLQQKKHLQLQQQQQVSSQSPVKQLSQAEVEKIHFMEVLDLYTSDALKEMVSRKSERKRRTTANPNYSFGFDLNRRDQNGSMWTGVPTKKARTGRGRGSTNWSNSTSIQDPPKPYKSNDNHDDYCAACGKGGQLLMCETCRLVYHLDCLNPPLTEAPKYAWSCPKCLVSGKGLAHLNSEALAKVHTYIAKKAAKEDERKKAQRKGREINTEKSFLDNRSKELENKMKEELELQKNLLNEEQKVKEDLSKLSNFVKVMRESRTTEQLTGPTTS